MSGRAAKPTVPRRLHKDGLDGWRDVSSRVTQVITGHAFTGEYYRRFVPSEPVGCPCGATLQTRQHILRVCRLHAYARYHLRKVSANVSLPIILGCQKGLVALVKILAASDAFKKHRDFVKFLLGVLQPCTRLQDHACGVVQSCRSLHSPHKKRDKNPMALTGQSMKTGIY
jgi:hypothetical protein